MAGSLSARSARSIGEVTTVIWTIYWRSHAQLSDGPKPPTDRDAGANQRRRWDNLGEAYSSMSNAMPEQCVRTEQSFKQQQQQKPTPVLFFFVHIITSTRRTQHKRPREHCEILLNSRDLPASQFCQLLYMKSL